MATRSSVLGRLFVLAFGCVILLRLAGVRAEQPHAKSVIERAIQSHGGEERLKKLGRVQFKMSGKYFTDGTETAFAADVTRLPGQERCIIQIAGRSEPGVRVISGNSGWLKAGNQVFELDKREVEKQKENLREVRLNTLLPLVYDKGIVISIHGEEKIDGQPAVGVKVSEKNYEDIVMYFGNKDGLLKKVSSVPRVIDGKSQADSEIVYSDYKTYDGTQIATTQRKYLDGKCVFQQSIVSFKSDAQLGDQDFSIPK